LNVGGKAEPLFVLAKDVTENVLYVGQGERHPGLIRSALKMTVSETHWIRADLALENGESSDVYMFRFRYRQPLQRGKIQRIDNGIFIDFESPQLGIAAGQFAAWYSGNECIGSGVISD
jgi:tRNA-specific 2-thiouridylase